MTRPSTSPTLAQIRNPTSLTSQVSALKALKNELIGHEQKKEMWIGLGIVGPVVQLLGHSKTSGKRRTREANGSAMQGRSPREATEDDEARLQATIIVGSLAFGGPAYVAPLLAASALPPLLAQLSIEEVSPHTVLATLRTLNTIADALLSAHPTSNLSISSLSNLLISRPHLQSLTQIISQSSSSAILHEELSLAASLIAKTCREERHQTMLVNSGVLDALAGKLASYVNFTGFNLSGVEHLTPTETEAADDLISQTPRSVQLAPILEAIGVIIAESKYRASQLLYSLAITSVFPLSAPVEHANPWGIVNSTANSRQSSSNPIDHLLPHVPSSQHKTTSVSFPPLGSSSSRDNLSLGSRPIPGTHPRYSSLTPRSSRLTDQLSATNDILAHFGAQGALDEDESPLISWLLYVTRAESGMTRLMTASTLAILYRAGLVNKRRETDFAHLLVPILVKMFAKSETQGIRQIPLEIMERAPTVLALLVTDSGELQKAAVEAHAIKSLSRMLKTSFDSIEQPNQPALWTADGANTNTEHREGSTLMLGQAGLSRPLLEKLKLREAALKGLAALAPSNDEYRKLIIETGATPFIVASMKPFGQASSSLSKPPRTSSIQNSNAMAASTSLANSIEGNPASVLIAACGTVRALSRSISILRTSLIDAGVAMPLFALMKSSDIEVKIAASAAICNLVLEFSPMREIIVEAGVLKLICEHAHSSNPRLRLNGVWALKHLVFSADNKVKISCLEELGQGWLVQLICEHSEDSALSGVDQAEDDEENPMDLEDAYGTPVEPESQELFEGDDEMEGGLSMASSVPRANRLQGNYRKSRLSGQAVPPAVNARLAVLRDAETNPVRKARRDDIAVQEQGLDFIRNLICGPGSTEMIDVLFNGLGENRVFEILASKLRPRVVNTYGRGKRGSSVSDTRFIHPPGQIVAAVCFIIVHIAAGNPRHRQLLVAQTELLKLLVALFDHPNKNVRAAVAWTVINLTWVDDEADKISCRKRALELRKLGFLSKLESMGQDPELDVRERCKTALFQMETILH